MGKNGGGQPTDTILTLEEALMRFKHERSDAGAQTIGEGVSDSIRQSTARVFPISMTKRTPRCRRAMKSSR
jgi:hypothetical protein